MTPELWQKAKDTFHRALELGPGERASFIADSCMGDDELRREVEVLLAGHEKSCGFTMATSELPGAGRRACQDSGELQLEDPEALVGATVDGSYRVERFLGRGGMGTVYLAEHVLLHDRVALKLLAPEYRSSADRLQRFLREGRMTRAVRHPNVVAIHELRAPAEGPAYMVLEYVEGRTLREEMKRRGPQSTAEVVAILEPIASALDHAHANGLLHRDLKPENVMVGEGADGPVVKLLDLGIAKLLDVADSGRSPDDVTMQGQVVGTPSYMSPEQWGEIPRDGSTELDGRSDVYSLGALAFEMLAGRRPFEERVIQELRRAHTSTEPPRLEDLVDGISPATSAAIAQALSKDRSDRQATAGALVAELRAALTVADRREVSSSAGEVPTLAGGAVLPTLVSSTGVHLAARSSRSKASLALLVASALIAGAYWLLKPGSGYEKRSTDAGPPPSSAPGALVAERALRYSLVVKRAGARAAEEPLPSPEGVVFRTGDGIRASVTSPDEGFLYVINEGPVLDAATGLPRYTVIFPTPFANGGSARLAANQSVRILERDWIEFGGAPGTERLWLVWSARSLEAFAGVGNLVNREQQGRITDPARVEAMSAVLAVHSVSAPEALTDVAGNQTTLRVGGDVLVHPLQFEHR